MTGRIYTCPGPCHRLLAELEVHCKSKSCPGWITCPADKITIDPKTGRHIPMEEKL